eukprot:1157297-Pelagomonas_calceolata.AAC.3
MQGEKQEKLWDPSTKNLEQSKKCVSRVALHLCLEPKTSSNYLHQGSGANQSTVQCVASRLCFGPKTIAFCIRLGL